MGAQESIFFDFNLPNATSWFYFSLLLAVALFFKFSRLLSVRNLDVITLFLLVPGLLLLQEAPGLLREADANGGSNGLPAAAQLLRWLGYLWLLSGSVYFVVRCLFDLALVRRPALSPNLNLSGLGCLGAALFGCLVSVAFRPQEESPETVGKR